MKHNIRQHIINGLGQKVVKIKQIHGELGSRILDHKGKEIFENDIVDCEYGYHFCTYPLAVFGYYYPGDSSRFALVEAVGDIVDDKNNPPNKFCTNKLKIIRELALDELIQETVKLIRNKSVATNTGNCSVAIVTGRDSKAKGELNCWLVLSEWDKKGKEIINIKAFKVDGQDIMPDTYYTLKKGQAVICQNDED